jgi:hypothetical protein
MNRPSPEADELISRLDDFIRRHHRNTAVRGVLMATGAVLAGYLAVAVQGGGPFSSTDSSRWRELWRFGGFCSPP